jgi:hypothetical protein
MVLDDEGFEIPEEYLPLPSKKDLLIGLNIPEYNKYINLEGLEAEYYYKSCILKHLKQECIVKPTPIVSSYYDKETNSIEANPGYILVVNFRFCGIIKEVQND